MKISIIIPSLKRKSQIYIPKFLQNQEIIISREIGRSRARNLGAMRATNDFLLFLDDDVIINEHIFREYILWTFGEYPNVIISKHHPILGTRVMGILRKHFMELGGFDETMETGEDADFGFRALQAGMKICYLPEGLITHAEHPRSSITNQVFMRSKNKIRYMIRYHKCWSNRGVSPVSPKGFAYLLVQSARMGLPITVQVFTYIAGFFYYILFDHSYSSIKSEVM